VHSQPARAALACGARRGRRLAALHRIPGCVHTLCDVCDAYLVQLHSAGHGHNAAVLSGCESRFPACLARILRQRHGRQPPLLLSPARPGALRRSAPRCTILYHAVPLRTPLYCTVQPLYRLQTRTMYPTPVLCIPGRAASLCFHILHTPSTPCLSAATPPSLHPAQSISVSSPWEHGTHAVAHARLQAARLAGLATVPIGILAPGRALNASKAVASLDLAPPFRAVFWPPKPSAPVSLHYSIVRTLLTLRLCRQA
jgi:hypothetical protein